MPTIERTHRFPRDRPIDCRGWLRFAIVESTYQHWKIRFEKEVDAEIDRTEPNPVELGEQTN